MFSNKMSFSYRENVKPETPVWKDGESDPHMFYKPVDEYTSREFSRNYGGHPRSDIALLNEQSDITSVQWILDKLQQRPGDGVGPEVSDKDLAIAHKSKYCQTASEVTEYYERILEERDNRELAQMEEKERASKEKEFAERRKRLRESLTQEEREALRLAKRKREVDELLDD